MLETPSLILKILFDTDTHWTWNPCGTQLSSDYHAPCTDNNDNNNTVVLQILRGTNSLHNVTDVLIYYAILGILYYFISM